MVSWTLPSSGKLAQHKPDFLITETAEEMKIRFTQDFDESWWASQFTVFQISCFPVEKYRLLNRFLVLAMIQGEFLSRLNA